MTKEAANRETTIVLAGLLTQAELPLLVFPVELPVVTEDDGEELRTADGDNGEIEEEGISCITVGLGLRVFEGGVSGTEVGLVVGVEMEDEGRSTVSEPDDPPVIVKGGEMLPEDPITEFDTMLSN